jgi:hypothetical protein
MAVRIVPEIREFNDLLQAIAIEVANATEGLLNDLDRRIDVLRAGTATPEGLQSLGSSPELQQDNDRVLLRPSGFLSKLGTPYSAMLRRNELSGNLGPLTASGRARRRRETSWRGRHVIQASL